MPLSPQHPARIGRVRSTRRALPLLGVLSGILLIAGCAEFASPGAGGQTPHSTDTPMSTAAPSADLTDSGDPLSEPSDQDSRHSWAAMSDEAMGEVLINSSDLPDAPDGYSAQTGVDYFAQYLAPGTTLYSQSFGGSACAAAMDSINSDLMGADPEAAGAQSGLIREFQLASSEEKAPMVYAWMVSYDHQVDSLPVWNAIYDNCLDQALSTDEDQVTIEALTAEDFTGVSLTMELFRGDSPRTIEGYSATLDLGRNLLMISAVDLEESDFLAMLDAQQQRIDHAQLAEDS